MHRRPARGPALTGSGRHHRGPGRGRLRCPLRPTGQRGHRPPTTHRHQTRTPPGPGSATRTTPRDHQNRRRGLHDVADHPAAHRGCGFRCRPAISSGCPGHRVETRPPGRSVRAGAADAEHHRCVPGADHRGLAHRGGPPPARAAHHGGRARGCQGADWRPASGPAADRRRAAVPDLRCHLRSLVRTQRTAHRGRPNHPHHQPPAAPRPRAPPPHLRGTRLWSHPRPARPSHSALGRRRGDRAVQPGAGVPISPPAAPSWPHHHHRVR